MRDSGTRCGECDTPADATARFCSMCGTAIKSVSAFSESRRIVTVLFVDLVGSTPLAESIDPEALRTAMDSFYQVCTSAIYDSSGVPEKFIGDAVMAVFGAYNNGGDGALRAVESALAIRSSMKQLNVRLSETIGIRLDIRCGIQSGEAVVVGSAGFREPRIIGDVVNTAARLQTAAGVNQILVGDETVRLIGPRLQGKALQSITLKGKRDPVLAHNVIGLGGEAGALYRGRLLAREAELAQLHGTVARTQQNNEAHLAVVSGPPGIGKSRLVREFVDSQGSDAQVLHAVCQAHGRGLTYQPIADLVRCLPDGWDTVVSLLGADESAGDRAIDALAAALDVEPGGDNVAGVADIAWAVRCLMTVLARQKPLLVVLEDLHHAEPTLLDLIGDVVATVHGAVTVLCTTRPDLYLANPRWGDHLQRVLRLELATLSASHTERLIKDLFDRDEVWSRLPQGSVSRIVRLSDGNPLYAELLVAAAAVGNGPAGLPSTVRVLLESWLDRLPTADREVLRHAATMGAVFTRHQLLDGNDDSTGATDWQELDFALERLLGAGTIQHAGSDGHFRFSQSLVRETLYEMTAKSWRARRHLAEADRITWLTSGRAHAGLGAEGALAHHLEAAYQLYTEVQPGDLRLPRLAARAADALIDVGSRALRRKDLPAAITLLERGRDLVPPGDRIHQVLAVRINDACSGLAAWTRAENALARAETLLPDDPRTARLATVLRRTLRMRAEEPMQPGPDLLAQLESDPDDSLSWCRYLHMTALQHFSSGRLSEAEEALRAALDRTHALDKEIAPYEAARLRAALCELTQWSPTHVNVGIALCADLAESVNADRTLLVPIMLARSRLLAMADDVPGARATLTETRTHIDQLQLVMGAAAVEQAAGFVEGLAVEHAKAREHYQAAAVSLAALGLNRDGAVSRLYCAREMLRSGDSAAASSLIGSPSSQHLDSRGTVLRWALQARLSAMASDFTEARAAIEETVAAIGAVDDPILVGDAWFDLAVALWDLGCSDDARRAAGTAESSYRVKGAVLPARHVERWLASKEEPWT